MSCTALRLPQDEELVDAATVHMDGPLLVLLAKSKQAAGSLMFMPLDLPSLRQLHVSEASSPEVR